jgi:hypothetical protein
LGKRNSKGSAGHVVLVGVYYPQGYQVGSAKQPTTLDGFQLGSYFLSYGKHDGWGRTRSCSGTLPPQRERVHAPFGPLSDDFTGREIGPSRDPATHRGTLLKDGYLRLRDELKRHRGSAAKHGKGRKKV